MIDIETTDAAIAAALDEIGRSRRELALQIDGEMQRIFIRAVTRAVVTALTPPEMRPYLPSKRLTSEPRYDDNGRRVKARR